MTADGVDGVNQDGRSGIALEVIALITPVPDIRVCSRNTTMQWGSDAAGMREAAEQFNASFALSGHLQRAQERIRIIARLTDIRFDKEVWIQSYVRKFEDLFAVQNEIARAIVGEILGQVRLSETLLPRKTASNTWTRGDCYTKPTISG